MEGCKKERTHIKCIFVGDWGVGRGSFILTLVNNKVHPTFGPDEHSPYDLVDKTIDLSVRKDKTATDESSNDRDYHHVSFHMWKVYNGGEDYDRLRPLAYPGSDVAIIGFVVNKPWTLDRVRDYWYPEITHYLPDIPILLVGYKVDLRQNEVELAKLKEKKREMLTPAHGHQLAEDLGVVGYYDVSSVTGEGMDQLVEDAVRSAVCQDHKRAVKKPKERCTTS